MNLFNELNPITLGSTLKKPGNSRSAIAHFCEHDGICISFTQARRIWRALAPCALKPWWLFLEPMRKKQQNSKTQNNKNTDTEVTNNA